MERPGAALCRRLLGLGAVVAASLWWTSGACTASVTCTDGTCAAASCVDGGEPCSADAGCVEPSGACGADADCCSMHCQDDGRCADGEATCAATCDYCEVDADCCSGWCDADLGGCNWGDSCEPSILFDCDCACGTGQPAADLCNDPAHPSFCAGLVPAAGEPCESALMNWCGFTADDIAALVCD